MLDPCDVYCLDWRTARKLHKCRECRGEIQPKEKYHYHHGVFDGSGFDFKTCQDCEKLRIEVDAGISDYDDKTTIEGLHEAVFESGNLKYIKTFLQIKERRKAVIPDWMTKRFDELVNEEDEKVVDNDESLLYDY